MSTSPRRFVSTLAVLAWAAAARAATATSATDASPPDALVGEDLYVGKLRFANGGAPCLACHGVAGHGLARAASFGPDLTTVHASYGDDGLEAALAEVPFPSMQPIYAVHALTAVERRDLSAFLAESAGREPPRLGSGYPLGIAGAAAAFLILFAAIGRRRAGRRPSSPSHGATP
jgi:mono/diheme cytochrome c family protein